MSTSLINNLKLFNEYDFDNIEISDSSLQPFISLKPVYIPWSGGRHEHKKFKKSEVNIVERLVNKLMRPGKAGGKKAHAIALVRVCFKMIYLQTNQNPVQILINAIVNSAPAEDVTTISYGGAAYHVSVDVSPQRRVDVALRNLTNGARRHVKKNTTPIEEALTSELLAASNNSNSSYAVSKKLEKERIAVSSR